MFFTARVGHPLSSSLLLTFAAPFLLVTLAAADRLLGFSSAWAGWPFFISLFLIGMPHGAADLLVSAELGSGGGWRPVLIGFMPYFAIMVLGALALALVPEFALIVFAAVTFLHFRDADYQTLKHRAPESPSDPLLSAAGRAAIVLALPFWSSTDAAVGLLNRLLELLGAATRVSDPSTAKLLGGIAVGLGLVFVLTSWCSRLLRRAQGEWRLVRAEAVETAGLGIGLAVLNPLFAMGVYFLAWHSLRHLRELCSFLWPNEDHEDIPQFFLGIARIHLRSLPLLLPTIVVYAGMVVTLAKPWNVTDMALLIIVVFIVVTFPHHLQILRMFAVINLRPQAAKAA